MRRALVVLGALALAAPAAARGQTAAQLLEQGITRYQNFDFELAASSLRRALSVSGAGSLPRPERARALSYLAAVEVFRSRPDSARAAYTEMLILFPRYRPSNQVFSPRVLTAFEAARQATKVVEVVAADSLVDLRLGAQVFAPWAYATSTHEINVSVLRSDGQPVRALYRGALSDSLQLRWDGLDSAGATVPSGSYQLRVQSLRPDGQVIRMAQLPLDVEIVRRDTLPLPARPDSLFLPERRPVAPALKLLATGLALGGLTVALPTVFDANPHATGTRFVVGGALSIAGISAFFSRQPGREIPANISANATLRSRWEQERLAAMEENRRRIEDVRFRVRAGALVQMDRGAP